MSTKNTRMDKALEKASQSVQKPPVMQEIKPIEEKKSGKKKYLPDNATARVGARISEELKTEMGIALITTHKEYKTVDLFIAEAIRVFLNMKK
jgi:hypothetical protein